MHSVKKQMADRMVKQTGGGGWGRIGGSRRWRSKLAECYCGFSVNLEKLWSKKGKKTDLAEIEALSILDSAAISR